MYTAKAKNMPCFEWMELLYVHCLSIGQGILIGWKFSRAIHGVDTSLLSTEVIPGIRKLVSFRRMEQTSSWPLTIHFIRMKHVLFSCARDVLTNTLILILLPELLILGIFPENLPSQCLARGSGDTMLYLKKMACTALRIFFEEQ